MQIVLDFLTGKVGLEEFKEQWYTDPAIGKWVDGLVDLRVDPTKTMDTCPIIHTGCFCTGITMGLWQN